MVLWNNALIEASGLHLLMEDVVLEHYNQRIFFNGVNSLERNKHILHVYVNN